MDEAALALLTARSTGRVVLAVSGDVSLVGRGRRRRRLGTAGHDFGLVIRRVFRGIAHLVPFVTLLSLSLDGELDLAQLLPKPVGLLLQRGSLVLFSLRQLGGLFGFDARSGGEFLLSLCNESRNIADATPGNEVSDDTSGQEKTSDCLLEGFLTDEFGECLLLSLIIFRL